MEALEAEVYQLLKNHGVENEILTYEIMILVIERMQRLSSSFGNQLDKMKDLICQENEQKKFTNCINN